jgi:hypothetical protein
MSNARKRIVVVGLGRQGWAVVRQFLKLWEGDDSYQIYVYDINAEHEDRLLKGLIRQRESVGASSGVKEGVAVKKLRDEGGEVRAAIANVRPHLLVNASTFTGHEFYTQATFEIGCDYIDLGQNTWAAMKQRALDHRILEAGKRIRIVPECGLAPGLVNILGAWLLQLGGDSLQLRVGGLPIDTAKGGELHYGLSWSPEGLIQEYTDVVIARKDGRLVSIIGLYSKSDREEPSGMSLGGAPFVVNDERLRARLSKHMEGMFLSETPQGSWAIQQLEARPTSDGISLMPFDSAFSNLQNLEYKTLRFYPHFDQIEKMISTDSVMQLKSLPPAIPDMVLLRVWVEGQGKPLSMIEGVVLCDEDYSEGADNGLYSFSAMQHLTGWPTVLVADALLNYDESATDGSLFREDHVLWSGRSLHSALHSGGVIMPYELVSGERILNRLNSDLLIPEREFRQLYDNHATE